MFILDDYKRNFIRWGSKYVNRHIEDPTYNGFLIKFYFDEWTETYFDDLVPGSLLYMDQKYGVDDWPVKFSQKKNLVGPLDIGGGEKSRQDYNITSTSEYSALNYLKNTGLIQQTSRSPFFPGGEVTDNYHYNLLQGMLSELMYVQNKTPWFFQSISGLDSAYKINTEGFRVNNGGQITINTLESIDRRISFILDAYRKVAFDTNSMTWVLPENLRKFGMEIILTEFNTIHTKDNIYRLSSESFTDVGKFLQNNFPGLYNTIKNLQSKSMIIKQAFEDITSGSGWREILASTLLLDYFSDVTTQVIRLHECEFDVFGDYSTPYLADISMVDTPEALTNSIPIKFKRANIINNYSLLEHVVNESRGLLTHGGNYDIGNNIYAGADIMNVGSNLFEKYEKLYYKDRDELAEQAAIKKVKDIAQSILLGNYNPLNAIKNKAGGMIDNLKNVYKS